MSDDENKDSFLSRWSSRKRKAAADTLSTDDAVADVSAPVTSTSNLGGQEGLRVNSLSSFGAGESEAVTEGDRADLIREGDLASDRISDGVSDGISDRAIDGAGEGASVSEQNATSASIDVESEEPLLTDADMPAIESLTAESDVSGFFNKGVSTALRKAALRHVFQLPKFNIRDGLNDYDGDYTVFEPLGDTITSDMKFHAARHERNRLEAEAEAERAEELARQEQSLTTENEKDEESDPVADTQEESKTNEAAIEDSNLEEGGIETVDDSNSPLGEGGDDETEQDSQLTPVTHAHNDDAEPRQVSPLAEKTEQV